MSDEVVKKDMCDLTHKAVAEKLEDHEHKIQAITGDVVDLKLNNATLTAILKTLTDKKSFWDTETGKKLVMWGFWLLAILLLAAIGRDYFIDKIPQGVVK